jgi:hypothetical protein
LDVRTFQRPGYEALVERMLIVIALPADIVQALDQAGA